MGWQLWGVQNLSDCCASCCSQVLAEYYPNYELDFRSRAPYSYCVSSGECSNLCPSNLCSRDHFAGYCWPSSTGGSRHCIPCASCSIGNYPSETCLDTRNTKCTTCSNCPSATFKAHDCNAPPFFYSETQCLPCAGCESGKYKTGGCTGNQNTLCSDCSTCPFGKYKIGGCLGGTNTQDTICADTPECCSQCCAYRRENEEFSGGLTDTVCMSEEPCKAFCEGTAQCPDRIHDGKIIPRYYQSCLPIENNCADCSRECQSGYYKTSDCYHNMDIKCEKCKSCSANFTEGFWKSGCRGNLDGVCQVCTKCPQGKYVYRRCQEYTDNVCLDCEKCPANSYSSTGGCLSTSSSPSSNCFPCPLLAVSSPNTISIYDCFCDIGTYGSNGSACSQCPSGKQGIASMKLTENEACEECRNLEYSAMGARNCYVCPKETITYLNIKPNTVIIHMYMFPTLLTGFDLDSVKLRCNIRSTCYDTFYIHSSFVVNANVLSLQCQQCSTNVSKCPIGTYHFCDGSSNTDTTCKACPSGLKQSSIEYIWDYPLQNVWGTSSCTWHCAKMYFKESNFCFSCIDRINIMSCPIGYYVNAQCLLASYNTAPFCSQCTLIPFASQISAGMVINDAFSCLFECNIGYFKYDSRTCTPWNHSLICPIGYQRIAANATHDYSCSICILRGTNDTDTRAFYSSNMFFDIPNTCSISCVEGAYLDEEINVCLPCSQGKYKDSLGIQSCIECTGNTYTSNVKSINCKEAPLNSTAWKNASGFTCNRGFFGEYSLTEEISCRQCPENFPNSTEYLFNDDGTCDFSIFLCRSGFYRKFISQSNIRCLQCPSIQNMNFDFNYSSLFWKQQITSTCGPTPSICNSQDELNVMCYEKISCNIGYYRREILTSTGITLTKTCVACRNTTCTPGYIQQLCQNPEQENTCIACTKPLTYGQTWEKNSFCKWHCDKGFFLDAVQKTCIPCKQGKYKPIESNDTDCGFCPSNGMYSDLTGSTACKQCEPGKYAQHSTVSHTTACTLCLLGSYSNISSATECLLCSYNTFSDETGLTACKECTNPMYPYAPIGSSQCYLPSPPCKPGFFLPSRDFIAAYSDVLINVHFQSNIPIKDIHNFCQPCISGFYCSGNNEILLCTYDDSSVPSFQYSNPLSVYSSSCSWSKQIASSQREVCQVKGMNFIPCPENTTTFGAKGSTSILNCHPKLGYYGLPGAKASICPVEHYCDKSAILPKQCPNSTPWALLGSSQLSDCSITMFPPCRPGYFLHVYPNGSLENSCTGCPRGSYCPGDNNVYLCDTFPTSYSDSLPLSISFLNCSKSSIQNNSFLQCPTDTFVPFDVDTVDEGIAIRNVMQCRAKKGYYFIPILMSNALICPQGFYCPESSPRPIQCQKKIKTCNALGWFPNDLICPSQGMFTENITCISCSSISQLLPPNGYYAELDSCEICCAANFFKQTSVINPNIMICMPIQTSDACIQGYYMNEVKSRCSVHVPACSQCTYAIQDFTNTNLSLYFDFHVPMSIAMRNHYISSGIIAPRGPDACHWLCRAGSYYDASSRVCTACPAGKYNPDTLSFNTTSCYDCPFGTYSAVLGSVNCDSCGKWSIPSTNEICIQCSMWNENNNTCLKCNKWNEPLIPRVDCMCMSGTYRRVNYFASPRHNSILHVNFSCDLCDDGYIGINNICTKCIPGKVCSINKAISELCRPGFYRYALNTVCLPCPQGTYSNITTAYIHTCTPCPVGTFANSSGHSNCLDCPFNTYTVNIGSSACIQCPSKTNFTQTKTCECPEHYYFSTSSNTCISCKYSSALSCKSNATFTPCSKGSLEDTSKCICTPGFSGDGEVGCAPCQETESCTCGLGQVLKMQI